MTTDSSEIVDSELDEPLTPEMIAETVGCKSSVNFLTSSSICSA